MFSWRKHRERRKDKRDQRGMALVVVTMIGFVAIVMATTLFDEVVSELNSTARRLRTSEASQAAEAGINEYIAKLTEDHLYYAHYVHAAEDTRTSSGGVNVSHGAAWPYDLTWTYPANKTQWKTLGNGYEYNLRINPPTSQTGGVRIISTGRKTNATTELRSQEVVVRPAAVSDFQMMADADIAYGAAATTYGKIYAGIDSSNVKHNISHNGTSYGNVYAEGNITTSPTYKNGAKGYNSANIRTVIKNPVNFNNFTTSLSDIQSAATYAGIVLNDATANGWMLQFNAAGTVSVSRCVKSGSNAIEKTAPICGSATVYTVPSNGAIYSNQSVMVKGVVKGRVTVAASGNVVIADNITYNTGGVDVLGLIATADVVIAKWCPNDLTWWAASIAQGGAWHSYDSSGTKGTMTYYGSTATFAGGYMDMFTTRVYNYDSNLLYLEPPYFPILEEAYTVLSFRDLTGSI